MRWPLLLQLGLVAIVAACADSDDPSDAGTADGEVADAGDGPCDPANPSVDIRSEEGLLYTNGRFSPDGTEVALLAWRGLAFEDIVIVDRCGENVRELGIRASAKAVSTWSPTWSADGTQIYFVGSEDAIRRVSAQGGVSESVVPSVRAPVLDLSLDGRVVLYGAQDFRVLDLETRTSTALGVFGTSPRISPDGTRVAFTRDRKIEVIDIASKEITEVATFDSLVRLSVAWFSSGDRLALTSELGVEIVELGGAGGRRNIAAEPLARDVDVSRDDESLLYGLNGQAPLRVLRGFD